MSDVDRVASGSAGAPEIEDEIEITPEMIEAGRRFLYDNALNTITSLVDDPEFVSGLYRRMKAAAPS